VSEMWKVILFLQGSRGPALLRQMGHRLGEQGRRCEEEGIDEWKKELGGGISNREKDRVQEYQVMFIENNIKCKEGE